MVVMFGMMMFVSKMSVSAAAASAAAAAATAATTNPPLLPPPSPAQSSMDPDELKKMQSEMGDPLKMLTGKK